ncbi:[pyruvate dehydrogenase (acetyl-transferring)] kinase [Malassezia japonica]|uniref:cyclin-dependent kinase n=1 Tax=Malassezia japonica TaxID=223818 RepID=A0AAF0J8F0_9BASI|nr:[pyruvate dehydrogenase (acetyl-transferring)] kinase [Malassezia japonica]WFD37228.1 [pyruvate dehydrogenase (acetyl-transferring)] kinase [Malassezia japonica]
MREWSREPPPPRPGAWGADRRGSDGRGPHARDDRGRDFPRRSREDDRYRSPPRSAYGARSRWGRDSRGYRDREYDARGGWRDDRKRRYGSTSPDRRESRRDERRPDRREDRSRYDAPRREHDQGRVLPRKQHASDAQEARKEPPPSRSLSERLGDKPMERERTQRAPTARSAPRERAPSKPHPLEEDARNTPADDARRAQPDGPPPPGPPRALPRALPLPRCDEAYEIVDQVGEGTYGQVYKASAERTGALVALKKIRMEAAKEGFPVTSMREIKLLQSLRHENVIRLHEIMTSRTGSVYMVFEYMEHDLNGILVHPDVAFTPAHKKSLAAQLLQGLAYLHKRAVLHRDLKGSNLLLNNAGILKIADFGLARTYYKRHQGDYTNRVVTLWYRPPELLLGATQYGPEVDMWGAGCLFLELFTRHAFFQGHDEIHQLHVITERLGPLESWPGVEALPWFELMRTRDDAERSAPDTPAWAALEASLSPAAQRLARGLLTYDPTKRLSAADALQSDYFTNEDPAPEAPASVLAALRGEWHEMQSKRARKKARAQ